MSKRNQVIPECDYCPPEVPKFNSTTHKRIVCPNSECESEVCMSCVQSYLLTTDKEPHCSACNIGYTILFMEKNLTKTWVERTYRNKVAETLLKREKTMIPEAIEEARAIKIRAEISLRSKRFVSIRNLQKSLRNPSKFISEENKDSIMELVSSLQDERDRDARWLLDHGLVYIIDRLDKTIEGYCYRNVEVSPFGIFRPLRNKEYYDGDTPVWMTSKNIEKEKKRIIHIPCPTDKCRGFLDETYICAMCEIKYCERCHKETDKYSKKEEPDGSVKKKKHKCNPDDVKSVKEIKKTSRRCPNCGVPIHKIEGCDQMFCVKCHTPFSYETGKIETGRIHNPHYYEMLRQGGNIRREARDIPCGGMPNFLTLQHYLTDLSKKSRLPDQTCVDTIGLPQFVYHVSEEEIPLRTHNDLENNRDLRIKYIIGDITEKEWLDQIRLLTKKREKDSEIRQILQAFVQCCIEISRNFEGSIEYNLFGDIANFEEVVENYALFSTSIINICSFTNTALARISWRYKVKVPLIKIKAKGSFAVFKIFNATISNKASLTYLENLDGIPTSLDSILDKTKPKAKPKVRAKPKTKPKAKPKTKPKAKPKTKPKAKPKAKPKTNQ